MANDLISNMSYTSRDFNTIYPELLDLVKKITYKWDPSITNESDPGIILLKLNALIADKCNYNIDKNVLECFPLSVTQESNARQLYDQLGYHMKWYRSATAKVALSWIDFDNYEKDSSVRVTIPKFAMITDDDSSVVYTLLGNSSSELNSASDTYIYLDGESVEFNAIQGVSVWYDINGNTTIQANDLDLNNRLYFNDSDIAENGIFITNIDQENFASWQRKDNLSVENLGNTYYSFGVLPGSNQCYIEFPEDASTLFRNGISIVYIRTMGRDGNAPLGRLTKFYNDITTVMSAGGEATAISLNSDNVEIVNVTSGNGGEEKESIKEAYRGYKHTVGTFNTLITLRDYINAILNGPQLASNAIVTDRTNDIQCSYKLMTSVNNISSLINKVDKHNEKDALSAYNVKIYALQYASGTIDNLFNYNKTFELQNDTEVGVIRDYFDSLKAIPHDFSPLRTPEQNNSENSYKLWESKPYDWDENCYQYYMQVVDPDTGIIDYKNVPMGTEFEENKYYYYDPYFVSHYCIFKYLYPIECTITTNRTLDDEEKKEVISNIRLALYDKLNAKRLDFGESLTEYELAQIITESDENISYVNMKNTVGQIYVTYWNGKRFITLNLSDSSEKTPYLYTYSDSKFEDVIASNSFMRSVGFKAWGLYTFKCIREQGTPVWAISKLEGNSGESSFVKIDDLSDYALLDNKIALNTGDWFSIEINPIDLFKNEIFVKSVLQGVTPLFINDTDFNYDINQVETSLGVIEDVESVECNVNVPITSNVPYYTLKDNESLKFYTSNLLDGSTYSNFVKYYYVSNKEEPTLKANTNTKLVTGEYLFLFYKTTNNQNDLYEYEVYGDGNIICPTFNIEADNNQISQTVFQEIADNMKDVSGKYSNVSRMYASTRTYRGLKASENNYVANTIFNYLSDNKTITTKFVNSLTLPSSYQYYWVLNNRVYYQPADGEAYYKYVLFEDYSDIADYDTSTRYTPGQKAKVDGQYYECLKAATGTFDPTKWKKLPAFEYTLDTNEYLFYKTSTNSTLNILGAGTRITREQNNEWSVQATSISSINNDSEVLKDLWKVFDTNVTVGVVEQQYVAIGEGATVLFRYKDGTGSEYTINSNEYTELSDIESIYYTFDNLDDNQKMRPEEYDNQLPNLSNVDNWRAVSMLNLSLGDNEEQILLSNQQINLILKSGESVLIEGQSTTEELDRYPQVIQSYFPIEALSSSNNLDVYVIDEEGNKEYNKIYNYAKLKNVTDSSKDRVIYHDIEGGATVFFPAGDFTEEPHNIDLTFKVPPAVGVSDGYIFSIYNPHDNLSTATLTASISTDGSDFEVLYPIGTKTEYNLNKPGTYFFNVDMSTRQERTLKISLGGFIAFEESSITINRLYKYHKPDDVDDTKFSDYVELLSKFDPDRQFQYTYQVPETIMIEDPLDSDSFLNPHHIYNFCTMYQHNFAKEKFTLTSLR